MKRALLSALFLALAFQLPAQQLNRPRLVVGLVVDQMRWDYLYRFYDRYSDGGFRRLLREGFSCENAFIPYTSTYTAAGHACIYSGSVPALNGIVGNHWYDRQLKKTVYCTEDSSVATIGSSSAAGRMSPRLLWSTTITDELRLASNFKSKTIAISLKDRGSILPGGHASNGSYWFDNASGGWITSSFYMSALPSWITAVNKKNLPEAYLNKGWQTLYPIASYENSTADSNNYEGKFPGEDIAFPHSAPAEGNSRFEAFRTSPAGNSYVFETARAAIVGEGLGADRFTDFLALSFSATDYAGHSFGPNSIEVEDVYLRFDRELAAFLNYLDARIGKGRYLLFLTSDHSAAQNIGFLADHKLPGEYFDISALKQQVNDSLRQKYGMDGLIERYINHQFYLNDSLIRERGLDKQAVKQWLINLVIRHPAISQAVDLSRLNATTLNERLRTMLANGYNQKLSGDVQIILRPQWFEGIRKGTTHGLWNPYDSHIPLLWFGWNVKPGKTSREVYMTDIAPTLAAMLHIQMPSASVGQVIGEVAR